MNDALPETTSSTWCYFAMYSTTATEQVSAVGRTKTVPGKKRVRIRWVVGR